MLEVVVDVEATDSFTLQRDDVIYVVSRRACLVDAFDGFMVNPCRRALELGRPALI
jgi:hypothetical protein